MVLVTTSAVIILLYCTFPYKCPYANLCVAFVGHEKLLYVISFLIDKNWTKRKHTLDLNYENLKKVNYPFKGFAFGTGESARPQPYTIFSSCMQAHTRIHGVKRTETLA